MAQVFDLQTYRVKRKKDWVQKNQSKLELYLSHWFSNQVELDFMQVASDYQATQSQYREEAWDYLDLRCLIEEELANSIVEQLYQDLRQLPWFDPKFLSKEKVLEVCLSYYIMSSLKIGC